MSRQPISGPCHLCGLEKVLSFEHVPPRAAFNHRKVLLASVESYWNRPEGVAVRGRQFQRGFGADSLCVDCNNMTGRRYAPHFIEWCRQGMEFYDKTAGRAALLYFQKISPLPVLKQIVTMFLALNEAPGFLQANSNLVRFVLDQEACNLDPRYRFWIYYVAPGPLRRTPLGAVIDITTGKVTTGFEFSFPPFGYMMTLESEPRDRRPFEITRFSRYRPGEMDRINLNLEVLPNHGPMLGDYRTFKEMKRQQGDTNVIIEMEFNKSGRR